MYFREMRNDLDIVRPNHKKNLRKLHGTLHALEPDEGHFALDICDRGKLQILTNPVLSEPRGTYMATTVSNQAGSPKSIPE